MSDQLPPSDLFDSSADDVRRVFSHLDHEPSEELFQRVQTIIAAQHGVVSSIDNIEPAASRAASRPVVTVPERKPSPKRGWIVGAGLAAAISLIVVGLVASGRREQVVVAASSASTTVTSIDSPVVPGERLRVTLDDLPLPAANGDRYPTTNAHDLSVVVVGAGAIGGDPAFGGRTFGVGGQQRDNTAYLTERGVLAGQLVDTQYGAVTVTVTPTKSVPDLVVPTGRNMRTYVHVVADDTAAANGGDPKQQELLLVQMGIDPDKRVLLIASVNNNDASVVLSEEQQKMFAAGQPVTIRLSWESGTSTLSLNDAVAGTFPYRMEGPNITDRARLSIGASADYAGGYFSSADHLINQVVFEGPLVG